MREITKDMVEVFTFNVFTEIAHEAPSHCIHVYFDESVKKFRYTITDTFNGKICYNNSDIRVYRFNNLILNVNHTIEYYFIFKNKFDFIKSFIRSFIASYKAQYITHFQDEIENFCREFDINKITNRVSEMIAIFVNECDVFNIYDNNISKNYSIAKELGKNYL
ncbi:MAG: hypothetical protein J6C46_00315 [Clostridia bacterium]|nr:hypothetical protein [Clostridia bacterium]